MVQRKQMPDMKDAGRAEDRAYDEAMDQLTVRVPDQDTREAATNILGTS